MIHHPPYRADILAACIRCKFLSNNVVVCSDMNVLVLFIWCPASFEPLPASQSAPETVILASSVFLRSHQCGNLSLENGSCSVSSCGFGQPDLSVHPASIGIGIPATTKGEIEGGKIQNSGRSTIQYLLRSTQISNDSDLPGSAVISVWNLRVVALSQVWRKVSWPLALFTHFFQ